MAQRRNRVSQTPTETQPESVANGKFKNPTWGRYQGDALATFGVLMILIFCPLMPLYFYISCTHFDCSIYEPVQKILIDKTMNPNDLVALIPSLTPKAVQMGLGWLVFQILLALYFPGPKGYGQLTPAGHVLEYRVNGLNTWFVSHALFIGGSYMGWWSLSVIFDNWGPLLILANIYGYSLAVFSYIKAHLFPSHPGDRKFSGNFFYDFFMGIEFNPRIGNLDFKLFHNGRPGITAWTMINISFAAAQYQRYGYVTNSMIIVNVLHAIYVIDFFYNEDWYLRTIDIAHDHFGFMLAWGDPVWLPWMYTLQGFFLVYHPIILTNVEVISIMGLGLLGYYIFRSVNHQKDYFRTNDGKCNIWGKPAEYVDAKFVTADGKQRSSKLLTSGWWGLSRHLPYQVNRCTIDQAGGCTRCFSAPPAIHMSYITIEVSVLNNLNMPVRGKYMHYLQ